MIGDRWPTAIRAGDPRALEAVSDLLDTMAQLDERTLTSSQAAVLQALADGHRERSCADLLGVSFHTVKRHLVTARARLGARNTAHAVAIAYRQGQII